MNIENYMLEDALRKASVSRRLQQKTKLNAATGCIEWTATARANGGYGILCVGRRGHIRAHRAAWALSNGAIPDGLYVCHRCDNPLCCNVDHLFLGTPKQNMHDKESKGRGIKPPLHAGETHHNAKFGSDVVEEIRKSKETLEFLAKKHGVSSKTIWRIKKNLSRASERT